MGTRPTEDQAALGIPEMRDRLVYVVGMGPSVARLRRSDFAPGAVVVAVNEAVLFLRPLGLDNLVVVLQKDGCVWHEADEAYVPPPPGHACHVPPMVVPVEPELLLVSARESPNCLADYPRRRVIDVERATGFTWYIASVPVAAALAVRSGAAGVVLVALDGLVTGDWHRARPDDGHEGDVEGYRNAGLLARDTVRAAGLPVSLLVPS